MKEKEPETLAEHIEAVKEGARPLTDPIIKPLHRFLTWAANKIEKLEERRK